MTFVKIGESLHIEQVHKTEVIAHDPVILEKFAETTKHLKQIAPKANDFVYFSAIMMHSAEASTINNDGTIKLTKSGKPVEAKWDIGKTWKWKSNDPSIKAYKNANRRYFS